MFKNFKLYEADGSNNAGSEEAIKTDESNSSTEKVVDPGEEIANQIDANLEASRQAILQEEEESPTNGKSDVEDKTDGELEAKETKTTDPSEPGSAGTSDADKTATEPTSNAAGFVEVTDDYITNDAVKNFPEIEQKHLLEILNGIKGEQMSPKVFKNYIHTQNKIRYGSETAKETKPETDIKLPDPDKADYSLDANQQQEVESARIDFMFEDLKGKYPGLTKGILASRDDLNEFVSDLNINKPLDADEFISDLKASRENVSTEIKDYVYKAKNWNNIARVEMKKQVDAFVEFLDGNGLKPEDVKADISESWIVTNLMKNEDGTLNPKVMAHYKGDERIPVVLPNSILALLKDRYLPEMLKNAKSDGIKLRKETDPSPSLSSSSIKGKKSNVEAVVTTKTRITPGSTDGKAMDKILEQQKKAILESED